MECKQPKIVESCYLEKRNKTYKPIHTKIKKKETEQNQTVLGKEKEKEPQRRMRK